MKSVLDTSGATGAGWGNSRARLVDRSGSPFFGVDIEDADLFQELWRLEANQKELMRVGPFPNFEFSMIIDVDTDTATLGRLSEACRRPYYYDFSLELCLRTVVENISNLKWAYIPLSDEWYYALFVTSSDHSPWVCEVAEKIMRNGEPVYRIVCNNSNYGLSAYSEINARYMKHNDH
ncbi:MAG: hypothetical protein WD065_02055 [Planctomycetaceae bacterium]